MSSNCKSVWRISLGWWKCFNTGFLWWLHNLANLLKKKKSFKCAHKIGGFYDRCMLSHLLCPTLCNLVDCSLPRLLCPWDSPGHNTGMDCHSLLQGIFSTQGLNSDLLHCSQIFYYLSHQGSHSIEVPSHHICYYMTSVARYHHRRANCMLDSSVELKTETKIHKA